jgi:hypothetical protein
VDIDGGRDAVVTQRLADHRADGQVGYIVIVHDIEMHPFRTGVEHCLGVFTQAGEIG